MRPQTIINAINATCEAVRNLDVLPMQGIDRIHTLTEGLQISEPLPVNHTPDRSLLCCMVGLAGIVLAIGIMIGWAARTIHTDDDYIRSHAERMAAETIMYQQIANTNKERNKGAKP